MSSAALEEYEDVESEGGSVLVDWGVRGSTQSVPARPSKIMNSERNAISLYDSDSSDEMRQTPRRSSLLASIQRSFTDDNHSDEDLMILSDDDVEADSDEEQDVMERIQSSLETGGASITPITSPEPHPDNASPTADTNLRSSNSGEGRAKAEITALLVEDKPWRWKRRTQGASILSKFRSLDHADQKLESDHENGVNRPWGTKFRLSDHASDPKLEGDQENGMQRLRGSIFRTISLATAPLLEPAHDFLAAREHADKDLLQLSIDDDDEDIDEEVSIPSSQLSELDMDEQLDWESLVPLPNSFIGPGMFHPSMAAYLDTKFQRNHINTRDANLFVLEHSMLLRAILQLLEERTRLGIAHIDLDGGVILKQGTLKKLSQSVGRPTWKVKYIEVRQGSFSYYEDTANNSKEARKTIPLAGCKCSELRTGVGQFVFELLPENCPRRLFMCSSEEERQSWLRAINEAKQGRKEPVDLCPYSWSIDTYRSLQSNLCWSLSKGEYMLHLGDLTKLKLEFPIQWVLEEANHTEDIQKISKFETIDFWRFLEKQFFVINGHEIPPKSLHGPELIIGALSRCILEYDHSSQEERARHDMLEVQAVSYARDVLMACWQSRARDCSHFALDNMCQNKDLVIVLPMSTDPKIYVNVSYLTDEDTNGTPPLIEKAYKLSGWVTTRSRAFKNWKNRYCVVSEGVLSYYEHAHPRPHGLRGQVVLVGATLNVVVEKSREDMHLHILQILSKDHDRERYLSFRELASFEKWKEALQLAIDLCTPKDTCSPPESPGSRRRKISQLIPTGRLVQKGMEGGGRIIAEGGLKVIKGASNLFEKITRKSSDEVFFSTDMEPCNANEARLRRPSVQVRVESCSHYKIMTSEPKGDELEDTWVTVRANSSQPFKLSGGADGCFVTGDELVELEFFNGLVAEEFTMKDKWRVMDDLCQSSCA